MFSWQKAFSSSRNRCCLARDFVIREFVMFDLSEIVVCFLADLECHFYDAVLLKEFEGIVWQSAVFVCHTCPFLVVA